MTRPRPARSACRVDSRRVALSDVGEAYRALAGSNAAGKIVIDVAA
jgi:hypothetical protein